MNKLRLSNLHKTWIIDLDGVIFRHNAYLINRKTDLPIKNTTKFLKKIPKTDYIMIITARKSEYLMYTQKKLKKYKIRYNKLIMDLPSGERILINDIKPSGLKTAHAINLARDVGVSRIK